MPWNVGDKTIYKLKMATNMAQYFVGISKTLDFKALKYNVKGNDHKGDRTNHAEVKALPWNIGDKTIYNFKMATIKAQYFLDISKT